MRKWTKSWATSPARAKRIKIKIRNKIKIKKTKNRKHPTQVMSSTTKPIILILCTGNSCRSHMAEGILRHAAGDLLDVQSAGSKPAGYVHPKSIQVLKEIGIDLASHHSKHMNEFLNRDIETVITVCGNADQACPLFPGQVNRHHWGFDDPAHATGSDEEVLAVFRRVRDEIRRVFEAYAAGRREGLRALAH